MVIVAFLGLVVHSLVTAKQREALNECWSGVPDGYCGEAHLSDDGTCVLKILPDGAECRTFEPSFCELSCVCKGGLAKKEERDCDDGNLCTLNQCGYTQDWLGNVLLDKPFACTSSFASLEGASCGQDQGGVCFHGFCVMLYDTIYTNFP